MKARVLPLDSAEHRQAQALLPWYVSATLDEGEAEEVSRHLAECARCRSDAAEIARVRALPLDAASETRVRRGWSVLRARMKGRADGAARQPEASGAVAVRGLQIAVVLQAAIILVLAIALLWARPQGEPYRALGSDTGDRQADALVVFRADATATQIADAMHAVDARFVGAPTANGAYLLRFEHPGADALARLRASDGVLSATSLIAEDPR